jgi:dual specificity phosphatase 3
MAMDYSQITERLFTGAAISTNDDVSDLVAAGVTHIIDARSEFDDAATILASDPGLYYIWDPADDDGQPKPDGWYQRAITFAIDALSRRGKVVFTHCAAGVNRGPSLAFAILRAQGMSDTDAFNLIKRQRPQAQIAYRQDANRALTALGWTK